MKLYQVVSIALLVSLACLVQFATSCHGSLRPAELVDFDGPDEYRHYRPRSTSRVTPASFNPDIPSLRVLSYNVFLRPPPVGWGDANDCRARRIGEELAERADQLDIVALSETFAKGPVETLVENLGNRFPYRVTRQPSSSFGRTNGGLSLFSRFPIRKVYAKKFNTCSLDDCLATKGFIHAIVELSEQLKVNVISTHLDAGGGRADRKSRARQLNIIRDYMTDKRVGQQWPTLLMGDMNVDGIRGPGARLGLQRAGRSEYQTMLQTLSQPCEGCTDAACAQFCNRPPTDLVADEHGPWAFKRKQTQKFNSMNCVGRSLGSCKQPEHVSNWTDRERLDYIFAFDGPPTARYKLQVQRARHLPFADNACQTDYLSDHKAVQAELRFSQPALAEQAANEQQTAETETN
jgi:endonuclease/exonuclease/phosphatase family metal-dependent hydrolase